MASNQKNERTIYASFVTLKATRCADRWEAAACSCSAPPSLIGWDVGTAFGLFVNTRNLLLLLLHNSRSVLLIVEAFSLVQPNTFTGKQSLQS